MAAKRSQRLEELLELVSCLAEQGPVTEARVAQAADCLEDTAAGHLERAQLGAVIEQALAAGLLCRDGDEVRLTDSGAGEARFILRRHRLAERLLHDLFALDPATAEQQACEFEHILLPEVVDAVCTLLGHPPVGPDGTAIPPGPCCAQQHRVVKPLVESLRDVAVGAQVRVAFIAPGTHQRLDRLAAIGLGPGSRLRLHQKRPAYVIALGETTLALDEEIAAEIYVRREMTTAATGG
jgi:DtxR family transcriptional regulator, Mn-dependent transcriptional regulator